MRTARSTPWSLSKSTLMTHWEPHFECLRLHVQITISFLNDVESKASDERIWILSAVLPLGSYVFSACNHDPCQDVVTRLLSTIDTHKLRGGTNSPGTCGCPFICSYLDPHDTIKMLLYNSDNSVSSVDIHRHKTSILLHVLASKYTSGPLAATYKVDSANDSRGNSRVG